MKFSSIAIALVCCLFNMLSFGQSLPSKALFFDEGTLAYTPGTNVVSDASANKGSCIFRDANTQANTMWFGPYHNLDAGDYLVSFRLKVASNSSSNGLITIDIVGAGGGSIYNSMVLIPQMFKASNQWQLFTLPVSIPHGAGGVEFRGIGFQPNVTGLGLDYVEVTTASPSGLFSQDFTVNGLGNVGVGTSTPKEKLSVNGKIRAHEIKVETDNWPDYVFEKGYELGTLESLASYVQKHKHLPEVPAAKDMERDGIAIGEMNRILLKKVEELTLHLIEKDRQIKHLEERVSKVEGLKK